MDPWSRIKGAAFETLMRMLELDPNKRVKVKDLERLDWVAQLVSILPLSREFGTELLAVE